jgi:hypothetical protein
METFKISFPRGQGVGFMGGNIKIACAECVIAACVILLAVVKL